MGDVTIDLTPCVHVEIRGDYGGRPALMEWMNSEEIWQATPGSSSGPTFFIGNYTAEDAEKIRRWVEARCKRLDVEQIGPG